MPKLKCKCGVVTDLSNIPCEYDWLTFSDTEFDNLSKDTSMDDLYYQMKIITKCPNCGRLYIYWNGIEHPPPMIYKIEDTF